MEGSLLRRVDDATRRAIDEQVFNACASHQERVEEDPDDSDVEVLGQSPTTRARLAEWRTVWLTAIPLGVYSVGAIGLSNLQTLSPGTWVVAIVLDGFLSLLADECRQRGERRALLPSLVFQGLHKGYDNWKRIAERCLRLGDDQVFMFVLFVFFCLAVSVRKKKKRSPSNYPKMILVGQDF